MNVRITIPWDERLRHSEDDFEDDMTLYPNWHDVQSVPQVGHALNIWKDVIGTEDSLRLVVEEVEWHYDDTGLYVFVHTKWRD